VIHGMTVMDKRSCDQRVGKRDQPDSPIDAAVNQSPAISPIKRRLGNPVLDHRESGA